MDEIPQSRECSHCGMTKPYTVAAWYAVRGQPVGAVCKTCHKKRKRVYDAKGKERRVAARLDAQRDKVARGEAPAKSLTAVRQIGTKLPGELPAKHLEVARALNEGAGVLNRNARRVLARILEYATDKSSPHHDWALKMLGERIMPSKLYTAIGEQAAGVKAGAASARPQVNINISVAPKEDGTGGGQQTIAVDVTPEGEADGYSRLW